MKDGFLQVQILALLVLSSIQGGTAQSASYDLSAKAVESVPDIVERLNSPSLEERIGVLDQLMVRNRGGDFGLYRYSFELPGEDYCVVARRILEGGLRQVEDTKRVRGTLGRITEAAMQFRLSELVPEVAAFLDHSDPMVQIQALMIVGHLDADPYAKEIAKLASSANPDVHRPAVELLLESNAREAVPALIQCLDDDSTYVQRRAIEALARIGDLAAVESLLPLLKTQLSPSAISALVRLDAYEAIPHIRELYDSGQRDSNLVKALAYFGDEEAIALVVGELSDANEEQAWGTLDSLVAMRARAAIPALISVLESEKIIGGETERGPNIVGGIMTSLARLGAQEAIPVLQRYMRLADDHTDAHGVRAFLAEKAVAALGALKARQAIPELLPWLDYRAYSFRNSAQMALAQIGEPSTAEAVIASLENHRSSSNHVQVLEALANISDPQTYQVLLQIDLPTIESSPIDGYLRQIADASGVEFALGETQLLPEEKRRRMVAALSGATGMGALRRVIQTLNYSSADYSIFVSDGVVHVVTVDEAYERWDKWLDESAKNQSVPAS